MTTGEQTERELAQYDGRCRAEGWWRVRVFSEVEVVEKVVDGYVCNKCGKSTMKSCGSEHASLEAYWGYDSDKDCEQHSSDICEGCYDAFIATFAIPPTGAYVGGVLIVDGAPDDARKGGE